MDASVIIPTHNRRSWVLRAVNSLIGQNHPSGSYEIIVSCDRCTDGTEESLRSAFSDRVRIINSEIPGQAGALNTGLKYARGEMAVVLDDEMEAEQGLVAAHIQAHRTESAAKIAVTGYSAVIVDSEATPFTRMMARNYATYFAELAQAERRKSSPNDLCGSNFSLRVSAFREVGGFNEKYFFQRNDFELAIRLLDLGYEIRFCREAAARQHLAVTADTVIDRTAARAQNDFRLACDYPWCVSYLPFYRVLTNPSARRRWRILWETAGPAAEVFRIARKVLPQNLLLGNMEYAARYCLSLRKEIGNWRDFLRLADIR